MSSLHWVAIRTAPANGTEFKVLRGINQREYPALLPFETVKVIRNRKRAIERKYALFPRYVFAGLADILNDYRYLRDKIPEIQGIVSRSRADWSPLVLTQADVALLTDLVTREVGATEVDFHKALRVGKKVIIQVGNTWQETKIDEITRKKVKVLLNLLGSMHTVEVPFDKVRAA